MNKPNKAKSIILVGCGGTGSILIPMITRYLAAKEHNYNESEKTAIVLIDGDVVEKKNLTRQSFFEDDIGVNKAVVFSEVISESYEELIVKAYDTYLDTTKQLYDIVTAEKRTPIFVGCVDSMICRSLIRQTFHMFENSFYLDGGNEFKDGQAVYAAREHGIVVSPDYSFYYGENLEGEKARSEMSCSDLNSVTPQHVLANTMSAMCLFWGLVQIYENQTPRGIASFDAGNALQVKLQTPELYGFSVDKNVKEFLDEKTTDEKLELAEKGLFINYLLNDTDEAIKLKALDFIEKARGGEKK